MMQRFLMILIGSILALGPYLEGRIESGTEPARGELTRARGGNPAYMGGQGRCDQYGANENTYTGCPAAGETCMTCTEMGNDGIGTPVMATVLKPANPPAAPGSMYLDAKTAAPQDCGDLYIGNCVVDLTIPGGFICRGDVEGPCQQQQQVGPQPPAPKQPPSDQ